MTEQQLRDLGPALASFLDHYLFCCAYTQTFAHLRTYVRGLLSDLPRKSVEPIALRAGTPVRTLQEFLKDHDWDAAAIRDLRQQEVAQQLATLPDDGLGSVGFIDETSAVKQGTKTPGVQRPYLGCVGKVDNGIVTVHLGLCRGQSSAVIAVINPRQHLASMNWLIVRHQHTGDVARHPRADDDAVGLHIRVVRRDQKPACRPPVLTDETRPGQQDDRSRPDQERPQAQARGAGGPGPALVRGAFLRLLERRKL